MCAQEGGFMWERQWKRHVHTAKARAHITLISLFSYPGRNTGISGIVDKDLPRYTGQKEKQRHKYFKVAVNLKRTQSKIRPL